MLFKYLPFFNLYIVIRVETLGLAQGYPGKRSFIASGPHRALLLSALRKNTRFAGLEMLKGHPNIGT